MLSPRQNGGDHRRTQPSAGDTAYQHAVGVDAFQAPGVGAEQERVADAALVDELLVQFADTNAAARIGRELAG